MRFSQRVSGDHFVLELREDERGLDDVAYVRFASVYRNFREAKDFGEFVGRIAADGD